MDSFASRNISDQEHARYLEEARARFAEYDRTHPTERAAVDAIITVALWALATAVLVYVAIILPIVERIG